MDSISTLVLLSGSPLLQALCSGPISPLRSLDAAGFEKKTLIVNSGSQHLFEITDICWTVQDPEAFAPPVHGPDIGFSLG